MSSSSLSFVQHFRAGRAWLDARFADVIAVLAPLAAAACIAMLLRVVVVGDVLSNSQADVDIGWSSARRCTHCSEVT